jgi:hypothetical protein
MAIQSNFPAIKPSLLLDFANTKQLDPRITFTRASTATFYNGVTTAMAEQNLATYSQQFDNASWIKENTSITVDSTTAPDGTTTADSLVESVANGYHQVFTALLPVATASSVTISAFVKQNTKRYVVLNTTDNFANYPVLFDLQSGVVVGNATGFPAYGAPTSSSITSVGNGWYRLRVTATIYVSASSTRVNIYLTDDSGSVSTGFSYTGNGTSSVYIWGAQLENRSSLTAYTATTTQAITNYIPVLQTAASGVARFDNNPTTGESLGLLIEESRTNLQVQSQYASGWTAEGGALTANTVIAPDGTLTGALVVATATTGVHKGYPATVGGLTTATTYTATVFMKAAGYNYGAIRDGYTGNYVIFDLSAGTVSSSSSATGAITSVGNGWYRCSASMLTSGTNFRMDTGICSTNAQTPSTSWLGNGFSGIYIWGAQFELGAFATSYIPTVASQVTRAADQPLITGTNFSSWFNVSQGTVYADGNTKSSSVACLLTVSAATFGLGNGFLLRQQNTVIQFGGNNTNTNSASVTTNSNVRSAAFYQGVNATSAANGGNVGSITTFDFTGIGTTTLYIGFLVGGQIFNGTIKKIAYYPLAVTSAQLQALTS